MYIFQQCVVIIKLQQNGCTQIWLNVITSNWYALFTNGEKRCLHCQHFRQMILHHANGIVALYRWYCTMHVVSYHFQGPYDFDLWPFYQKTNTERQLLHLIVINTLVKRKEWIMFDICLHQIYCICLNYMYGSYFIP